MKEQNLIPDFTFENEYYFDKNSENVKTAKKEESKEEILTRLMEELSLIDGVTVEYYPAFTEKKPGFKIKLNDSLQMDIIFKGEGIFILLLHSTNGNLKDHLTTRGISLEKFIELVSPEQGTIFNKYAETIEAVKSNGR